MHWKQSKQLIITLEIMTTLPLHNCHRGFCKQLLDIYEGSLQRCAAPVGLLHNNRTIAEPPS